MYINHCHLVTTKKRAITPFIVVPILYNQYSNIGKPIKQSIHINKRTYKQYFIRINLHKKISTYVSKYILIESEKDKSLLERKNVLERKFKTIKAYIERFSSYLRRFKAFSSVTTKMCFGSIKGISSTYSLKNNNIYKESPTHKRYNKNEALKVSKEETKNESRKYD